MPVNIVFAGTPAFSIPSLQALVNSKHTISCVLTQPDRRAGRGRKIQQSPIKKQALLSGLPVRQPETLKDEETQAYLKSLAPDLMIVIAYGLILPQPILDIPQLGCINLHASILPRWRGAAPIQRAILSGDQESGITVMQMDAGLDTGDMLSISTCAIAATQTGGELHDTLSELGANVLVDVVSGLEAGAVTAEPQDDALACYAHKIEKAEAQINWRDSAIEIDRLVRAFNPWPVAWTVYGDKKLRIWQARIVDSHHSAAVGTVIGADKHGILVATGAGVISAQTVQLPGGKPMPAHAFVNAHQIEGYCFASL